MTSSDACAIIYVEAAVLKGSGMSTMLPRLSEVSCKCLTVCGLVEAGARDSVAGLAKDMELSARFRATAGTVFMRLILGGRAGRHLHIDCALKEYFRKGRAPKVTHRGRELLGVLEKVSGWKIDVGIRGLFTIKLAQLPENGMIRRLHAAEARSGGMSMKLTAGRFSITGAPVTSIRWSVDRAGSDVEIDIVADRPMTVQEDYLQDCLDWINTQVGLFVLGRSTDEAR